jgi:hypothetical protein
MVDSRAGRQWLGFGAAVILSAILPACSSPNGPQLPWLRGPAPDSSNIVYRPAFRFPEPKTLVAGGYAGASYPPVNPRRRVLSTSPATVTEAQPAVSVSQGTWEPD